MAPPNRFGAALAYFANGYRYAFPVKATSRVTAYSLLSAISDVQKYRQPDTIILEQAMAQAVTSAWVYSGIKMIADRVAASDARPTMKRRQQGQILNLPDHQFADLLDQPNSLMTWEFVARYMTWWAFLIGNAYLFLSTPEVGVGEPEEIWPLPANAITPDPDSIHTSRLTGKPCINYKYLLNGKEYILPGENVVHVRFPNPFDYWIGMAPLSAMNSAIQIDKYQSRYVESYFGKDNAIPTAIISVPQETNPIDFETIKEQIREQFGSGRRSAITRAGDLSVQTISQTMQQMELINGRKFNREEINHVLGIPEGLMNGSTSGDSRLATEITFARITVQPFLDMMAAELTANLAPYYGSGFVVKSASVIPQDRALALQEYTQYSPDRSINENRKILQLPQLDMPAVMATINGIRTSAGLDEINTPLDSALMDLMLELPVRLIPLLSSNTFAGASSTGLRPGQIDAAGEEVEDPNAMFEDGFTDESGGEEDPTAPAFANTEKPPESPSMIGAPGGDRTEQINAGKSWLVAAARIGQREELGRWKKVAVKMCKDGKNPGEYEFKTEVLPVKLIESIQKHITGVDADKCAVIFDTWMETVQAIDV